MARATAFALLAAASVGAVSAARVPSFDKTKRASAVPSYALTYAPYSYLYSTEEWWPTDIAVHLENTTPEANYVAVESTVTLETLDELATDVYLTSNDDVEDNPSWLLGVKPTSGVTSAPATIIVVDKTDYVDVFYFYFYAYNHGLAVLGTQFGNHVGDWEHNMIRFVDGVPEYIYLSEHSGGSAYDWSAMDFEGERPITYIATGSHANYATTGKQAYEGGFLSAFGVYDETDAGVYWDVTKNYRAFSFDTDTSTFSLLAGTSTGATEETTEGFEWLYWLGYWGDEQYPTSDSRQNCDLEDITGECHYVSGPTGPYGKNLARTTVCEDDSDCTVATSL